MRSLYRLRVLQASHSYCLSLALCVCVCARAPVCVGVGGWVRLYVCAAPAALYRPRLRGPQVLLYYETQSPIFICPC
jgi:hypothetical protein